MVAVIFITEVISMTTYTAYVQHRLLHKRGRDDLPPVLQIGWQPINGGAVEWLDVPTFIESEDGTVVTELGAFMAARTLHIEIDWPAFVCFTAARQLGVINDQLHAWWRATEWQQFPRKVVIPAQAYDVMSKQQLTTGRGQMSVLQFVIDCNIMAMNGRRVTFMRGDE